MPRARERASALASLIVVCLGAAPLQAQEPEAPRVYIVSVPMEDGLEAYATRAGSAARAALRGIEGVSWQEPDQRFLGYDASALTVLERARERLGQGRQAYLNLELEQAISTLTSAVEDFDASAAAMEDPQDLGQALLFLGASHAFNGQRRQAQAIFRRLHAQMPHIQPDPNTFNPDVVQLYEQSRPADAGNPGGTLTIESDPPGAIAYVDFLARGRTPITVDRLIGGEHVVRVSRPGAVPFVETTTIRPRGAATSSAFLADQQGAEGLSEALEQVAQADVAQLRQGNPIAEIASILALGKIGVIRVSRAGEGQVGLELLLFDVNSGRRLVRGNGTVPTEVGALESGVQQLVEGSFRAALRAVEARDTTERTPSDETPWERRPPPGPEPPILEQWWFWTLIGVGAVALVATFIGIGVAAQGPSLGGSQGGQVIFEF